MIESITKDIILINGYWFSLPLIGLSLLLLLKKIRILNKRFSIVIQSALGQHPFTLFFYSFALAAVVFGIVASVCYLFNFPVVVFSGVYMALLFGAPTHLLLLLSKRLFIVKDFSIFQLRGETLLTKALFLLLCGILIGDFLISLYAKSHAVVGSDTYVHLSRMVAILSQGFTIESGYFRDIPESGYHFNLIYALYTAPSQIFNMMPAEIWKYSFGFFRLLQWVAIFTLASHAWRYWLGKRKDRILAATLATILAIFCFSSSFFIATYPNQIANIWLIILVIGLSFYELEKRSAVYVIFAAAFLLTLTHPTYALMAAGFICLFAFLKVVFSGNIMKYAKQILPPYILTTIILMVGPLRTATLPNRITEKAINIDSFPTIELWMFSIKAPSNFLSKSPIDIVLLLLGTVGLWFLLYKVWSMKGQRLLVFTLIIFYPFLVYTPFIFTILQEVLPLWVINRFSSMNILKFISIIIGIYALLMWAGRLKFIKDSLPGWLVGRKAAYLLIIGLVGLVAGYYSVNSYRSIAQYRKVNEHYYQFMERTHDDLRGILGTEKMVIADMGDSYFLAAVLPVDVIAVEEGHTTPAADARNRIKCQEELLNSLNYKDLLEVDAGYVILSKYIKDYPIKKKLADSKQYLKKAAENQDFYIYRFDENVPHDTTNSPFSEACNAYQIIENSR